MRKSKKEDLERLPPHTPQGERGVLGCLLMSPNGCITQAEERLGKNGEPFYDLRHGIIYQRIVDLHDRNSPVDMISLSELLKANNELEACGGLEYITRIPDDIPSPANLEYYLELVYEKFTLRRMIRECVDTIGRAYEYQGDIQSFVTSSQRQILSILNPVGQNATQEHWLMKDLIGYDVNRDPNAIVGWHDGKTTRYLCKGYGAWLIAQSGIGKSTLSQQQAYCWALNKPFFGIRPVRALRVLFVQNENDLGDCAEATQGILEGGMFTPDEVDLLQERVKIIRCRGKSGKDFCRWMEREIIAWRSDVVYVDPLLRFAGIDVSRQDQCTNFLNNSLDPVLANTGVVMIGIHHTGKPKSKKETSGWSIYDLAYSGIGSSELVNWARAVTIIQVRQDGIFEMLLAKRGARAWATHPDKGYDEPPQSTTSIYLKHAQGRIYWDQCDPPEFTQPEKSTAGGRPSKIMEIACSNLHTFLAGCATDGEGKNEVAKRLEFCLAQESKDASLSTCKRVIEALVANGKLKKTETSQYVKGPNA